MNSTISILTYKKWFFHEHPKYENKLLEMNEKIVKMVFLRIYETHPLSDCLEMTFPHLLFAESLKTKQNSPAFKRYTIHEFASENHIFMFIDVRHFNLSS